MNQEVLKEKELLVGKVADLMQNHQATIICEYRGLSVKEISGLRQTLRENEGSAVVYKNTLVSRAAKTIGLEGLETYLEGPNVYIFLKDFSNGSLKAVSKFAKRHDAFEIKAGVVDGVVRDKDYVKTLANLPSKEGLVSMLLSVLQAPMRNLAYSLSQVAEKK